MWPFAPAAHASAVGRRRGPGWEEVCGLGGPRGATRGRGQRAGLPGPPARRRMGPEALPQVPRLRPFPSVTLHTRTLSVPATPRPPPSTLAPNSRPVISARPEKPASLVQGGGESQTPREIAKPRKLVEPCSGRNGRRSPCCEANDGDAQSRPTGHPESGRTLAVADASGALSCWFIAKGRSGPRATPQLAEAKGESSQGDGDGALFVHAFGGRRHQ